MLCGGQGDKDSPLDFLPQLTLAAWILPPESQVLCPKEGTTRSLVAWKNSHG